MQSLIKDTIEFHELLKFFKQPFTSIITKANMYGYTKLCFSFLKNVRNIKSGYDWMIGYKWA